MPAISDRLVSWTRAKRRTLERRAAAATTYNIADDNAAISYSDTTNDADCWRYGVGRESCQNKWWRQSDIGAPYHVTAGPAASLQFTFTGSSVKLMGRTMASPAQAIISVDGGAESTISFASLKSGSDSTQPLWTSATMDESTPHVLRLRYEPPLGQAANKTALIGVWAFVVESTQAQANISTPPNQKQNQTVSIAAGLGGGIALLLVMVAFAFYWRRRGRRGTSSHQRIASRSDESSDGSSSRLPGMEERMRAREATPWVPSDSGHDRTPSDSYIDLSRIHSMSSAPDFTRGHHHASSSTDLLAVPLASQHASSSRPSSRYDQSYRGHHHSGSSTELLAAPQPMGRASSPSPSSFDRQQQQQRSHYAYDADHEPAAVPSDASLALDILPPPPVMPAAASSSRMRRIGSGGGSPTATSNSYESWTSSDFGPIPSPFVADAPPVPATPPLGDEKRRGGDAAPAPAEQPQSKRAAATGPRRVMRARGASTAASTTLPPRYSAILD